MVNLLLPKLRLWRCHSGSLPALSYIMAHNTVKICSILPKQAVMESKFCIFVQIVIKKLKLCNAL